MLRKDGGNGGTRIRQIGENCGVRKESKMLRGISRKELNSDYILEDPTGMCQERKKRMEQQSERPNTLNIKIHI